LNRMYLKTNILFLSVLEFLVPCHLNGLEFAFRRLGGFVGECGEFNDHAMQIGEANFKRILFGEFVGEHQAEVIRVIPVKISCHAFHS
jgi:hypothetical protein